MQHPASVDAIQVATWNVNFRRADVLSALANLQQPLDILTLQEVSVSYEQDFQERLDKMGLPYGVYTGRANAPEKRYGNIIASRWPVELVLGSNSTRVFHWPQLVAHATIKVGGRPAHVFTAHIPNGAGNGWAKIDTLRALAKLVSGTKGNPCILTGDFNEPQYALQDGRIVTFGQDQSADGKYRCWKQWGFNGRSGTGKEWDAAVRWFFENRDEHGLRHAYWEEAGHEPIEPTHISRGNPRWFDHIFVSEEFAVESCAYLHEVRLQGFSDHSALTARLAFGEDSK